MSETEKNRLFIGSALNLETFRPEVIVVWEGEETRLTITEARRRSQELFDAIAIAETELALLQIGERVEAQQSPTRGKGFAEKFKHEQPQTSGQMGLALLTLLREHRPMPPSISIAFVHHRSSGELEPCLILGWHCPQPIPVGEVVIDEFESFLATKELARTYAQWLLEAAESASTDAFLRQFFIRDIEVGDEEVQKILQQFVTFRQQNMLEDLLK